MAATVTPLSNGPLVVKGEVEVVDAQGKRLPAKGDANRFGPLWASSTLPAQPLKAPHPVASRRP